MRRIPETFESVIVPDRLRAVLYAAPLRSYARNCWHGGLYKGERRAPILQTHGTDTFSECLAFTIMHLVLAVADSNVREFDVLFDATAERHAIRLGAVIAKRLTDALTAGVLEDREGVAFDPSHRNVDRTLESFHVVSQVMYPSFSETRDALANYDHDESGPIWLRTIDHALFASTDRLPAPDRDAMSALVALLDETIASFYPYFLASMFGEMMYERHGIAAVADR